MKTPRKQRELAFMKFVAIATIEINLTFFCKLTRKRLTRFVLFSIMNIVKLGRWFEFETLPLTFAKEQTNEIHLHYRSILSQSLHVAK